MRRRSLAHRPDSGLNEAKTCRAAVKPAPPGRQGPPSNTCSWLELLFAKLRFLPWNKLGLVPSERSAICETSSEATVEQVAKPGPNGYQKTVCGRVAAR